LEPSTSIAIDMRRQVAVLANLSAAELRALARGDSESELHDCVVIEHPPIPLAERGGEAIR